MSRLFRRSTRYLGQHRPGVDRPLPSWPPAQDPWFTGAETAIMLNPVS